MIRSIEDAELITTSFNTKDAVMFNCLLGILSKQKKKKKWRKKYIKKRSYTQKISVFKYEHFPAFFFQTPTATRLHSPPDLLFVIINKNKNKKNKW